MAEQFGIRLKKKHGQHFLNDESVIQEIINKIPLQDTSVFEIGCGEGVLTRGILTKPIARLWVFEIDPEWAEYVRSSIPDDRLTIYTDNFLDIDFSRLESHKPWIVLANLPYQVTFPILYAFQRHRHLLKEGVIMVQEEVAQKVVKKSGRGYGFPSLFLQHYFDFELMRKIPPTAFYPPPKIDSRLLYFKIKKEVTPIPDESNFWKFIKLCFSQPRRTLRNNLAQTHYAVEKMSEDMLKLRAQQMSMQDLLAVWKLIN
ncbi:MAG: 16S rRNA (adenine(1518)-N(6)/adenine(1519)-N(6))-dimethyltransferase RsmA [Candidatus Babeliales bacterium]